MDELAAQELELHDRGNDAHGVIPTLHSFLGGSTSGIASIIAGQPFDTIKVRMQTSSAFSSAGDCLRQLLAKEGPQALFKGMASPVLSASLVNAIVFSSYNETMTLIKRDCEGKPTYSQVFVAGAVAGGIQCSVLCPTELIKCRLQVQTTGPRSSGLSQCIKDVYRDGGGVRGFYAGIGPILMRDIPAFAAYFSLYEIAKDKLESSNSPSLWLSSCVAGGFAGVMSWAVVYPFDYLKSIVQTQPLEGRRGMVSIAQELLRTKGPTVFFRGMSVAVLRALPVNSIVFPVYEWTVAGLGRIDSAHSHLPGKGGEQEGRIPVS